MISIHVAFLWILHTSLFLLKGMPLPTDFEKNQTYIDTVAEHVWKSRDCYASIGISCLILEFSSIIVCGVTLYYMDFFTDFYLQNGILSGSFEYLHGLPTIPNAFPVSVLCDFYPLGM